MERAISSRDAAKMAIGAGSPQRERDVNEIELLTKSISQRAAELRSMVETFESAIRPILSPDSVETNAPQPCRPVLTPLGSELNSTDEVLRDIQRYLGALLNRVQL